MSVRNLEYLYQPESIAIVGATDRPGIGAVVTGRVLETFKGKTYLINPSGRRIFRIRSVKSAAELPEVPDAAVVITPADGLEAAVEDLGAHGVKGAVIVTDPRRGRMQAAELRARIFQAARRYGLRINGPNSLGLTVPRLGLHATMSRLHALPGPVAFVGQSATAVGILLDWATPRAIGFSCSISLGDMVDVDYADVLYYLSADPRTRCIVLFAERLPGARRFMSAARHAARVKPVIIMKTGTGLPGEDGASAPAARDDIYEAAFRRAGLIRVRTLEDLFHAVEALAVRLPSDTKPARGERLAVMANGESICALAVDSFAEREGRLATLSPETVSALNDLLPPGHLRRNPVDLRADADGECFAAALEILGRDKGVDAVLAAAGPTGISGSTETARAVAETVARMRQTPGKRVPWVITSWPGGEDAAAARRIFVDNHIPHFDTPSMAVAAFSVFVHHRTVIRTLMETPASIPAAFEVDTEAARRVCAPVLEAGGGSLPASATAGVLSAYGMRLRAAGLQEGADPPPVFGLSLLLDPEFGPVFRFGLAGTAGRLLDPGVAALPPLNTALAKDVVLANRAGAALFGKRLENGGPPGLDALTLILSQVSQLIVDMREISGLSLEIAATGDDACICNAGLKVAPTGTFERRRELAIRPYPKELETSVTVPAGATYTLRPIRPEDEPPLQELFGRLSPEDVRMRFFRPLKALDHEFAARLTQIDYDRQMALILAGPGHPGEAPIHGVVRLVRDPDEDSGEFAVTVESALQGAGLGRLLMERIIDYGRSIGLKTIFGLVLADNRIMLGLCRKLGFTLRDEPGEAGVLRVELAL